MSLYRQGLSKRVHLVGAVGDNKPSPQSVPGFNAATDLALQRLAKEDKRYFGFAFKKLDDGTLMNIYHATDDVIDAADWYGSMSSGDDRSIIFATYYDTEKEPLHPVEKYLGVIDVKGGEATSWLPYIIGAVAAGLGLIIATRKDKKKTPVL